MRFSSSMVGKPLNELKGSASDALGELVNLVASGVQANLSSKGDIELTPTMVVSGNQFDADASDKSANFKQAFKVDEDLFCIECSFA